jgi:hypothetical protein
MDPVSDWIRIGIQPKMLEPDPYQNEYRSESLNVIINKLATSA